jgi:hypothetical protein
VTGCRQSWPPTSNDVAHSGTGERQLESIGSCGDSPIRFSFSMLGCAALKDVQPPKRTIHYGALGRPVHAGFDFEDGAGGEKSLQMQ